MLVVVMAFSGFVLYDALSGMPTYGKMKSGVNIVTWFNNPGVDSAGIGTTVNYVNQFDGGGVR
ncbi:MAG: hypothetical protein KAT77_03935 [Nanoarchaeota archaeon]|nr:hypothetical protein [Nanoarchaeota archaeon]